MKLCKHEKHKVIDWIKDPKWSTNEVLINVDAVPTDTDHFILRFANPSPQKKYGWFYLSLHDIIKGTVIQPNGRGQVYCVPLERRQEFVPEKKCQHEL